MLKYLEKYRNFELCQEISKKIKKISKKPVKLMEVCGTHTMSIFRHGIRGLLPEHISLISGPGCPVCVTSQEDIDDFIYISKQENIIITTFGDLIRVPGTNSSLQKEKAKGQDIRIIYSVFDALEIAQKNPEKKIVFLGVGFETTIPTIAAAILSAQDLKINNFFVLCSHKLLPPALFALSNLSKSMNAKIIDGFILPGHVSVIIGTKGYLEFFEKTKIPCVITGFEPVDILQAIFMLISQIEGIFKDIKNSKLENAYNRAVSWDGNLKAQKIISDVFETQDAIWRGIGNISQSGLKIKQDLKHFDAREVFDISNKNNQELKKITQKCLCGEVLTGLKTPLDCPLYKTICTPLEPVGPCMVSSEGTCAAFYKYYF